MTADIAREREQAHALLDLLPPEKVGAVKGLLEVMVEPWSEMLARVPVEDEELNDETVAAVREAEASLDRGEGVSHDEVLAEFGLR